jgi:cystathionine beta-lyase
MTRLLDNCPDRRDGESVKWNVYAKDILPMWVADMDVRSPQAVIDALQRRVSTGVFGYPLPSRELIDVIVKRMLDRYQWQIAREDVILVPGVVSGFNLAAQAFTNPGNSLIIQTPVYPPFLCAAENAGARGIQNDLVQQPDGRYIIDFDSFERAIEPDKTAFIMSNPHNPVGRVFTKEELEKLGEICLRHGVTIISDEIHSDLIYPGYLHIPIASISPEFAKNTVTFIAPSKTFNVAGLDCAVMICSDPAKRERLEKARKGLLGHVNLMGQAAALAAYTGGQEWLDQLLVELEENRNLLFDFVNQRLQGISMAKPEGTYLAWLDCRKLSLPTDPYHFFLEQARVAMNDGREFGAAGEGFLRLNFGCSQRMLVEALTRMETALNNR